MTAHSNDWLSSQLERLAERPTAQARLLLCNDDLQDAWGRLETLPEAVRLAYWREFLPYGRGPAFELLNQASEQLLAHLRPLTALQGLEMYTHSLDAASRPSPELVATALEALTELPEDHAEQVAPPSSYEIDRLLDYLRGENFDEERIALLEWRLLPARGFDARSPVLERKLSREPEFFMQMMKLCFRRRDGAAEDDIPAHLAQNAYRLLDEWKIVPGSDEAGGDVDEARLQEWVTKTRELAVSADRADIVDQYIGHVFAHSKYDDDGSWPTIPVRNGIERLRSRRVEEGFYIETMNSRGVTTRGLTDGGLQERAQAQKFDELAAKVTGRWDRTAAVLRAIAERYRADAAREDEQAERHRRGLG